MKNKSAIPVGSLYIVAFLILLSLAGMSLYLFLNSQSMATEYRIAAASILEISEEFKRFIDQERRFVMETVLYFLGSQGGLENLADYNSVDLDLLSDPANPNYDADAKACYELLRERVGSPSNELLYRCFNGKEELFKNQDSEGLWKCDAYIYSYDSCTGITKLAAKLCCEENNVNTPYSALTDAAASEYVGVTGLVCHQGCVQAVDGAESLNLCNSLDYCGALWCKGDNLEIPETYSGVPYYYKIGEGGPGYYCASSYEYSPEKEYAPAQLWSGVDIKNVIGSLVNLSNNYFYKPSPDFTNYLRTLFGSDVDVTFQLDFRGCNEVMCEFAWVPYGESEQGFIGRGFGGVPMIEFSTNLLSVQVVPIPIDDMVEFVSELITTGEVKNYFVSSAEKMVFNPYYETEAPDQQPGLADWNIVMGQDVFDLSCNPTLFEPDAYLQGITSVFDYYDDRYCGADPYNNDCNYNCLMQHASNDLYLSTGDPFTYDRETGYDYTLRPVFRFVKTSLGSSINTSIIGGAGVSEQYEFEALPGKYNVFISGEDNTEAVISIAGLVIPFSYTGAGDYYELVNNPGEIGRCAQTPFVTDVPVNVFDALNNFQSNNPDVMNSYNTGVISFTVLANDYIKPYLTDNNVDFNPLLYNSWNDMILIVNEAAVNGALDSYYKGFGCCPEWAYNKGLCSVKVNPNIYCNNMNNRFAGTIKGGACLLSKGTGVNYAPITLPEQGTTTRTLDLNVVSGTINRIDVLRVDYDNTMDLTSVNGQARGGGYEYYWVNETSDCEDPMGEDLFDYTSFSDEELWYSMLAIRAQGFGWDYIINNETGLFNEFKSQTYDGSDYQQAALDIDGFLRFAGMVCVDDSVEPVALRFAAYCEGRMVYFNNAVFSEAKENNTIIPELEYDEQALSFNPVETVYERLYQISLNTSYISLPLKWVFAYRDQTVFDQTMGNIGEDPDCNLNYADIPGSRAGPDCSCRECEPSILPDLDFIVLLSSDLNERLYHFSQIFVNNAGYQSSEVIR